MLRGSVTNERPNKPDAANPAMTLWLTIKDQGRRVVDLERQCQFQRHWRLIPVAQLVRQNDYGTTKIVAILALRVPYRGGRGARDIPWRVDRGAIVRRDLGARVRGAISRTRDAANACLAVSPDRESIFP